MSLIDPSLISQAKRTLGAVSLGYTVKGFRLVDPNNAENGEVITFTESEGAEMIAALQTVLTKRVKGPEPEGA